MKNEIKYQLKTFLIAIFITAFAFNSYAQVPQSETCRVDEDGNVVEDWRQIIQPNYGILHTGVNCPVRVGIGTDLPITTFDVRGGGYFSQAFEIGNNTTPINLSSQLKINAINRQVGVLLINRPINTGGQLQTYGIKNMIKSSDIIAYSVTQESNNTDVFRVMGNGNVFATKVLVRTTPFPDYVFNNNYKLMPLAELEAYINANKHLPNMPTAKTVEKEGADLGEINRLLVEKVEELTLYIINQEKRLKKLEQNKS